MLAFLSYLRQIRQSTQQSNSSSSSNQEEDASSNHSQDTLQPDINSSMRTEIPESNIQRRDSRSNPPNIAGTKRTIDSDHVDNGETKRNHTASSKSASNLPPTIVSTPTILPAPSIVSTSTLLPAPTILPASKLVKHQTTKVILPISYSRLTPTVPEVVGRSIDNLSSKGAKLRLKKSGPKPKPMTRQRNQQVHTHSRSPPAWHSQRRTLFLALKNHPAHEMPRSDLITAALDLDVSISIERNFPLVFRSKTPRNSASAVLTTHDGTNFQSFKPFGSRSPYFRLPFKPANFDEAVATYRSWMETLITQDWPLCFGYPYQSSTRSTSSSPHPTTAPDSVTDTRNSSTPSPIFTPSNTEFDYFIITRKKERHLLHQLNQNNEKTAHSGILVEQHTTTLKEEEMEYPAHMVSGGDGDNDDERKKKANQQLRSISETIHWTIHGDPYASPIQSNIPTSWQDLVRVEGKLRDDENDQGDDSDDDVESENENEDDYGTGLSVFAKRRLPGNTPIGIYFGVPTTAEEFDGYKENYNCALRYCVMYDGTVLDATNDNGLPFTDPAQEHTQIYCPFHFMRQVKSPQSANVVLLKGNVHNQVICWTKHAIERNEELTICLNRRS